MINISEQRRNISDLSVVRKLIEYYDPELYAAESIDDYRTERELLAPPWFKKHPFCNGGDYAFVMFHNLGIDAIIENGKLLDNFVKFHDDTGFFVAPWNKEGKLLPAEKSYYDMVNSGELELTDFVHLVIVRHSYEGGIPFVAMVDKSRQVRRSKEKSSLLEKIEGLLPKPVPSYGLT